MLQEHHSTGRLSPLPLATIPCPPLQNPRGCGPQSVIFPSLAHKEGRQANAQTVTTDTSSRHRSRSALRASVVQSASLHWQSGILPMRTPRPTEGPRRYRAQGRPFRKWQ